MQLQNAEAEYRAWLRLKPEDEIAEEAVVAFRKEKALMSLYQGVCRTAIRQGGTKAPPVLLSMIHSHGWTDVRTDDIQTILPGAQIAPVRKPARPASKGVSAVAGVLNAIATPEGTKITNAALANRAGVSPATVERALGRLGLQLKWGVWLERQNGKPMVVYCD